MGNGEKGKVGNGLGVPIVLFVSGSGRAQIEKLSAFWGSLNCNRHGGFWVLGLGWLVLVCESSTYEHLGYKSHCVYGSPDAPDKV